MLQITRHRWNRFFFPSIPYKYCQYTKDIHEYICICVREISNTQIFIKIHIWEDREAKRSLFNPEWTEWFFFLKNIFVKDFMLLLSAGFIRGTWLLMACFFFLCVLTHIQIIREYYGNICPILKRFFFSYHIFLYG